MPSDGRKTTVRCGCCSALSNQPVALGHQSSHGSRTWSETPANYDSEARRLIAATINQFGSDTCTDSHLGTRAARTLYRTARSRFFPGTSQVEATLDRFQIFRAYS